jgi:hypothetical protein
MYSPANWSVWKTSPKVLVLPSQFHGTGTTYYERQKDLRNKKKMANIQKVRSFLEKIEQKLKQIWTGIRKLIKIITGTVVVFTSSSFFLPSLTKVFFKNLITKNTKV